MPYCKNALFLIGPDEEHFFTISSTTKFVFIKFTDVHIREVLPGAFAGLQHLEYLMKSKETHLSGFNLNKPDRAAAAAIINVILLMKVDMLVNEQLIWQQVLSLASLLQRNMPELKITRDRSRNMQAVFCYLHKHVYTPAKLRAPEIARQFNTTPDYIGPYFKRNTGITLREYISTYRKGLIKQRLDSGNFSLKQIAGEFGLTDESHVSKILK